VKYVGIVVIVAKGLCHSCLQSQVEVETYEEGILCRDCYAKRFSKKSKSPENESSHQPTFEELKRKMESR